MPNNATATVCMLIAAVPLVAIGWVALAGMATLWVLGVVLVAVAAAPATLLDYWRAAGRPEGRT